MSKPNLGQYTKDFVEAVMPRVLEFGGDRYRWAVLGIVTMF